MNIIRIVSKIKPSGYYFSSKYKPKFKDIEKNHPGWLEMTNKLSILVYNLYVALGAEYVVLGGGLIRSDMKDQILDSLKKLGNAYLPILNKKDLEQRLILNDNSDDLSLLGGIYILKKARVSNKYGELFANFCEKMFLNWL